MFNRFSRNTRLEKHIPLGAPSNPGGLGTLPAPTGPNPITGNTFLGTSSATPANAQGLQGAFGLQYFDVLLSSAQILALLGTPVTIVPAPGVGFRIALMSVKIILFAGAAAYTDVGGAVQFVAGGAVYALASNAVFLVATSPNRQVLHTPILGVVGAAGNPPSDDNAPLNITKITNNFAAGNGTAKVTVHYFIEPTT